MTRVAIAVLAIAVVASGMTALDVSRSEDPAGAADLGNFNPGNIISDQVFFDSSSMTQGDVYNFFSAKLGGSCAPGALCLLNYAQSTASRPADRYCSAYPGGYMEPSWQILWKVAQACSISPRALIVTLQKERGLVQERSTSSADWKISMGYGCPDTAACDSQYFGFYNQVWNAARQFRRYGNGGFRYNPGWNTIQYHPNAGCGSSRVFIANAATAALYNYTPYQPNAAALAAGYGASPDGCASYGNRNFFSYFNDWFGSTQDPARSIVQAQGSPEVYLLSGGQKHYIKSFADLTEFASRLGWVQTVSPAYLAMIPEGAPATRYVHDPQTGQLLLLQDGTLHHFLTADQVADYGFPFSSYVDLDPPQVRAFGRGADVSPFVADPTGSGRVFELSGSVRQPILDPTTFASEVARRGSSGFVGRIDARAFQAFAEGPTIIAPGTLVTEQGSGTVSAVIDDTSLIHIDSFALAAEYGMTRLVYVPPGTLTGWSSKPGSLSIFAQCGSSTFAVAGRSRSPLDDVPSGFSSTALGDRLCAQIPVSTKLPSGNVFAQFAGASELYAMQSGQLRHVSSWNTLVEMTAAPPRQLWLGAGSSVSFRIGAPIFLGGEFVQFSDSGVVYREENGALRPISQFATLLRLGGGRVPQIFRVGKEFRSAYSYGAPL